jgi:hypothetical protein
MSPPPWKGISKPLFGQPCRIVDGHHSPTVPRPRRDTDKCPTADHDGPTQAAQG